MLMRRVISAVVVGLFLVTAPQQAAAKDWWGWLEEFSGPGPFRTRGPLHTLHFTAMCSAEDEVDYHALDAAASMVDARLTEYVKTVLAPLQLKFPDVKLEFPRLEPTAFPLIVPPGIDLQFLLPSDITPSGGAAPADRVPNPAPGVLAPGVGLPDDVTRPGDLRQSASEVVRLQAAGSTSQATDPAAMHELLIAETVIKRNIQTLGTPLPFRTVQADSIRQRLQAQGITRAVVKPRLHRKYCVYVDYARFFADADPTQGYPDIRASKLDVGLAYFITGPLDISAAAGYMKFHPASSPDVFRWTFTPLRVQVRPFAWVEKFAPTGGVGRGLARLAYAPKLYVKQTALLRSIRASEFGSSRLLPDGSEFQTGPELVSSYGFAVDLTEVLAAFFDFDSSTTR